MMAFLTAVLIVPAGAYAQSRITFRIDMRAQMKDSTFIPGSHTVELTGNQIPFSNIRTLPLKDEEPADSVYVRTVIFPSTTNGALLKYNYIIRDEDRVIQTTERRPRLLPLDGQQRQLPVTEINSFYQ